MIGLPTWLWERELLARPIGPSAVDLPDLGNWKFTLDGPVLVDEAGLALLRRTVASYRGQAARVRLVLRPGAAIWREYYSLQGDGSPARVVLPVVAQRAQGSGEEELVLELPAWSTAIPYPSALADPEEHRLPTALLMPVHHDWDLLFANHIALAADLARRFRGSRRAFCHGLLSSRRVPLRQRVALSYAAIDPTADVHPTAVVEGSVLFDGARVEAGAVVRAEAGCIEYVSTVDLPLNPEKHPPRGDVVVMQEKWQTLDHLKAHAVAPHMNDFRGKSKALVKSTKVEVFEPVQ